jgi:uroporphyrinogen III methyltransferase / synthase
MNFKPLRHKTIVITRAQHQSDGLKNQLESLGVSVFVFPTLMIKPVDTTETVYKTLQTLSNYDWVIFTSANAVTYTMYYLQERLSDLHTVKIAAIGPVTQDALAQFGLTADLVPNSFDSKALLDSLLTQLPTVKGLRFLLPQANIARSDLAVALGSAGAAVTPLTVYQTMPPSEMPEREAFLELLAAKQIDMITFTSPSAINHFANCLETALLQDPGLLNDVLIGTIGPTTSEAALSTLGRVDIQAVTHTIHGLVVEIQRYYNGTGQPVVRLTE